MSNFNPANTFPNLSYANTFGDWVVTTNNLAIENINMAANNYIKPTGTLYLNDPTLGLQTSSNVVIGGTANVVSYVITPKVYTDTSTYFQAYLVRGA